MKSWFAGAALAVIASVSALPSAHAGDTFQLLQLDKHLVKWGEPDVGTGANVSYAFVTETTRFAGARNCKEMQSPQALLAASNVTPSDFVTEVEAAFDMWAAVADIRFQRVSNPQDAQILIGAETAARGTAFANVRYDRNAAPGRNGVETIEQSLVCLNPDQTWKLDFNGDAHSYDLRYTLAHEIGHAIGLDHPSPTGQLMSFTYEERFRDLQDGDIAGAVALYGERPEAPTTIARVAATPGSAKTTVTR